MYSILIIAHDFETLRDFESNLENDDVRVEHYNLKKASISNIDTARHDLVLFKLDINRQTDTAAFFALRNLTSRPICLLSDATSEIVKAYYLNHGADCYMTRPIKLVEASAQLRAIIRCVTQRTSRSDQEIVDIGPFSLHLEEYRLFKGQTEIALTTKEYELLKLFIENRHSTVSREKMIEHIYSLDSAATDNALNILITRLRKKLKCESGREMIETVWGFGYRLNTQKDEHRL